jgi:hypothetical protein
MYMLKPTYLECVDYILRLCDNLFIYGLFNGLLAAEVIRSRMLGRFANIESELMWKKTALLNTMPRYNPQDCDVR